MDALRWNLNHLQAASPRSRGRLCLLSALALFAVSLFAAGCRSAKCDLVEAQLFQRESELADAKDALQRQGRYIEGLEAEVTRLHRRLSDGGKHAAGMTLIVRKITLGRLTGGYDTDPTCPGDDALQVLLEPRDLDDASVKALGRVHIDLYEITPQGTKDFLCSWDLSPHEIRGRWENPLIGGPSYRLVLPWKIPPGSERLRVVVQFTTVDGVKFEADKDVTISPPPRPGFKMSLPPRVEELHMPRQTPPDADPAHAEEVSPPPLPPLLPPHDPFVLPSSHPAASRPATLQPVPKGQGAYLLPPARARK